VIDPWRAYTDFSTPLTMYEVRTKEKDMPFFFPLLRWHGRPWLSMRASYAAKSGALYKHGWRVLFSTNGPPYRRYKVIGFRQSSEK
jgi:hypothetical protein